MELFYANRKSLGMGCLATAMLVAFAVGVGQPVIVTIVDGAVYGSLLFTTGLLLLNIFRFVVTVSSTPKFRVVFITVFTLITSLLVTGVETFAFYLCFSSSFPSFVPTLSVRIIITFLLFIITCLFYLYYYEISDKNRDHSESMAVEKTTDSTENDATRYIDRITVRSGTKIKIIPVENILYIQADGDYISICTDEGKWLKEQTMNYTEDRLSKDSFVRIHRSYIVNIHRISRIERYGEKQLIVLHNNEKIKISAARYRLLRQILGI